MKPGQSPDHTLVQTVLSSSLLSHHFQQCPRFREQFLNHLRQCPIHRGEMEQLRAQAQGWAEGLRRKLLGF